MYSRRVSLRGFDASGAIQIMFLDLAAPSCRPVPVAGDDPGHGVCSSMIGAMTKPHAPMTFNGYSPLQPQ